MSFTTLEPVVVNPDMVSNIASGMEGIVPPNKKGKQPNMVNITQVVVTIKYPSFLARTRSFTLTVKAIRLPAARVMAVEYVNAIISFSPYIKATMIQIIRKALSTSKSFPIMLVINLKLIIVEII